MLVVEGLTCRFGTKAAVDNASFSIAPGGFVGVIGRSAVTELIAVAANITTLPRIDEVTRAIVHA